MKIGGTCHREISESPFKLVSLKKQNNCWSSYVLSKSWLTNDTIFKSCRWKWPVFNLTLTLPNLTKSIKRAFLLAHARSVFDDFINQIHILQMSSWHSWSAAVCFVWHAEDPGIKPGSVREKMFENISPVFVAPSYHFHWTTSAELGLLNDMCVVFFHTLYVQKNTRHVQGVVFGRRRHGSVLCHTIEPYAWRQGRLRLDRFVVR